MRKTLKKIVAPILQPFGKWYFSKPRSYRYKSITIKIFPGVFFPLFTLSTRILLQFLEHLNLKGKTFLELGCGTGIISVFAAKKGAKVTASDVNEKAVENTIFNARQNQVQVNTVLSDLFLNLKDQTFDYIVINPPYYPKEPLNNTEKAWYCGAHFEYFEALYSQINTYVNKQTLIYMILSEDCKINHIKELAIKHNLLLQQVHKKKRWGEWHYIFEIEL